jgi:hypothetical protein
LILVANKSVKSNRITLLENENIIIIDWLLTNLTIESLLPPCFA